MKRYSILLFCFAFSFVHAYELGTHGRLTDEAYKQSVLSDPEFIFDLGLDGLDESNPFGKSYYDISGSRVEEKTAASFEVEKKRMPEDAKPLSISGWLMRGAIREDDAEGEANPPDPVNPTLKRPLHHFYDPVNNLPLTVHGLSAIDSDVHAAPNWAVGGRDIFTQPNTQEVNRRNHFSVFDAREAMYRALTGRDSQGNVIAATETERNKYWATTFRALGDVVHLVQDMGQPQHTRNDPHAGKFPVILTGHKSAYEEYIEARAIGAESHSIDGITITQPPPLTYIGYEAPKFTKYSDYWSTRSGITGRGLADYSNQGFFSAGTNLGENGYASPSNNAGSYAKESAAGLLPKLPLQKLNFLKGDVLDSNLNLKTPNIKLTTESLFDAFLFTSKTYSLNRFNYDDMASLLVPRAVAYSAGLINHFFRGKIDFVADTNNPGKYTIKNLGTESVTGTFTLYYDAVDGNRYPVAGDTTTETWAGRTIAATGQLDNLSFTPPTNPAPKTPDEYMLVFKGNMGDEKAENGAVGAVIAKLIQQEGATDYVAMTMPNPVPYRGVSIGEVDESIIATPVGYTYTHICCGGVVAFAAAATLSELNISASAAENTFQATLPGYGVRNGQRTLVCGKISWQVQYYDLAWGWVNSGGCIDVSSQYVAQYSCPTGYELSGSSCGLYKTYVMTSDGVVLASEVRNTGGNTYYPDTAWSGEGYVNMYINYVWGSPDHQFTFTVPEDGVYPAPSTTSTIFNTRRQAWFKKNSDEFITALKTGFSPDNSVTRAELKTGKLPDAWELQIKRNVDVRYDSYPRDQYNVRVGRHTRRAVQYSEVAFSETVQSDTSANLSQPGVMVTKREVTLAYQIPVVQPDDTTTTETRNTTITGYLTQTVTRHNDAFGNWLGLSGKDVYENWYNRESTTTPDGVPSTITASYLKDRTNSLVGVVLNGTVQNGYNADSLNGIPDDPLAYALYNPPYPKWSSTVQASTPDFITTWHKDAKIEYLEDGVGASDALNDSALYGVKQIEITPVGLIADGNGNAPAGTALGIFSSGEKGTQAEIYGTAVYNFDWQTGALTFNKWKPLLDAGGNEVASKVINLPTGTVFPTNNAIITYKGLHWPDVIAALKVRDESLPTATSPSDKLLYELIKAINGG